MAQDLNRLLAQYWERILRNMGLDPNTAQPPVEIVPRSELDGDNDAEWDPNTGTIQVGREYMQNHDPQDLAGMIVHEGAHAALAFPAEARHGTRRQREPLANAVRYALTGTAGGWVPDEETKRLANLNPTEFRFITQALGEGKFSNRLLRAVEEGELSKREMRLGMGEVRPKTEEARGIFDEIGDIIEDVTDPFGVGDSGGGGGGAGGIDRGGAPGSGPGDGDKEDKKEDWEFTSHGEERDQASASFRALISSLGIRIDESMNKLVQHAYNQEWNDAMFMEKLRETAAYRQRFPGIFKPNGELKMTESDYMQSELLYTSYASQQGVNMGKKRMSWLFRNNVTPDEFNDRALGFTRIDKNKELYGAFKRELVQTGAAKPSEVNTNKELFKFVMGEGNRAWADLWQDSVTRYAANQAGITIAKNRNRYTSIAQKALERISSMGLSEEEMGAKFGQLAEVLGSVLPLQEADLYGVRKKTAIAATFGGKNSERARQKIERAISTDEAFYEDRAGNQVYSDEQGGVVTQGVTDRGRKQQSEY